MMKLDCRSTLQIALLLFASGCSTVPAGAGFSAVAGDVGTRMDARIHWRTGGAEDQTVDAVVNQRLAQPLTSEAAVQVALLNNRALQAEYEELGMARADLAQAGLLPNPTLAWSHQQGGGISKTGWGLEFDMLGLLLSGPLKHLEAMRFDHARLRVTQAVLAKAAETRKAWVEAMAARQSAAFLAQVGELAEAELGRRQRHAGNLSQRDAMRQQAFALETSMALSRAEVAAFAARERLNRLMGLNAGQLNWSLPPRLPEVPASVALAAGIVDDRIGQRLDVQLAQKEAEALAAALNLTRDARFIRVLDVGVASEKSTGEKRITGPTLKIELPIFDQGREAVNRQQAQYRQSEFRLYETAVNARSEIRDALQRLKTAHANARLAHDQLVPLQRRILEESTLHYNGMLIGVYELLADARAQIGAVQSEIDAVRDYWTALADLQLAVGGKLDFPEALDAPAEQDVNHGEHGGHGEKP